MSAEAPRPKYPRPKGMTRKPKTGPQLYHERFRTIFVPSYTVSGHHRRVPISKSYKEREKANDRSMARKLAKEGELKPESRKRVAKTQKRMQSKRSFRLKKPPGDPYAGWN